MNWILDIGLVALVVGTIIFHWRRGFIKAILGFGRTLLSVLAAIFLGPKVGAIVAEKVIGDKIANKVYESMASIFDSAAETVDLSQLFEQAPESFVKLIERFGCNLADLEAKYGDMTAATHETLFDLAQTISAPVTTLCSNLIGIVAVFLVTFLFLLLFSGLFQKLFDLPVLKQINHLLGLILGILIAALNAFLFCVPGSYLLNLIGTMTGKFVAEDIIAATYLFELIANIKIF